MFGTCACIEAMPGAHLLRLFDVVDKQNVRNDEPHGKTTSFAGDSRSNDTRSRQTFWIRQRRSFVNPANVRISSTVKHENDRLVGRSRPSEDQDLFFHRQRTNAYL